MNTASLFPAQRIVLALVAAGALLHSPTLQAASYAETVLADTPVVYYRLEDPADSYTIANAVNPDAYQGNVVYDDFAAFPKFEQAGIDTRSVGFHVYTPDGGTPQKSHIEVPYDPELNPPGQFSLELWARATSWSTGVRCIVGNISSYSDGWWFRQEAGTTPRWIYVQNGGGIYMAGGNIAKNEWAHLVVTYDGTTVRFYGNGEQQWTSTGTVPSLNLSGPLCLGGNPAISEEFFDGNIDEVAIYATALTADQVRLHHEVGRANIAVPPIPPSVVQDPAPASAYAGRTATFTVNAEGTSPLLYQWYKGNTPIDGATTDILSFTCDYADNGATYKVVVTNPYGSATSAAAALTVMTDLTVETQPASITRNVGSKAAFIAVSGGALPVTYQWYKAADPIPGATDPVLWLSNVQLADDQTLYSAKIANPWMNVETDPAILTVVPRAVTVPVDGYAKVVMADDPVAFWRLDEPDSSTTAVDAAGSFDGQYALGSGAITYGVAPGIPHESNPAVAVTGKAHVQIPWALELNPHGPFTAEFWFQPASLNPGPDFRNVISSEGAGPNWNGPNGWLLYHMPDNTLVWVLFSQGWNGAWVAGGGPVEAGAWYHAALAYDGALFHTYLDGEPVASQAYTAFVPNGDGFTSLGFRFDGNGAGFEGALDDVAFYREALTPDQIRAHSSATVRLNLARSENAIVLSWPFGTLQQADQIGGAFTDLTTATSPWTVATSGTAKYYRVRIE